MKQKVGGGGLPEKTIEKAQTKIQDNKVDFTPYAKQYLADLNAILELISGNRINNKEALAKLAAPVMQLKANGGMFGYPLISDIADTVLLLLDNIDELNDDVIKIIHAHQNSLQIIVNTRLAGKGGREGALLVDELGNVCMRFYKKYNISPQ